jgi:hypothetical protein
MSLIHDQIKALQLKASVIDFATALIASDTLFDKSVKSDSPEARAEVAKYVRQFLARYVKAVEDGVDIESALTLTSDDIIKLKAVSERLAGIPDKPSPAVDKPQAKRAPLATPKAKYAQSNKTESPAQSAQVYPFKASIMDTSYIQAAIGQIPNTHNGMMIWVVAEKDGETYVGEINGRPGLRFDVPKDCIENI